jgi:hypothetical protein
MNKHTLIIITFVLGIGAVLFADQLLAIFHGMSPLQAMQMIWTFVLHVAVTTIVGYVVVGLPAIVKPWLRMFLRKRKATHRGMDVQKTATQRAPRINKDQVLLWMASQMTKGKATTETRQPSDDIQIKL